jgi:RNA polymerase sigma factor (sigma-70 family)
MNQDYSNLVSFGQKTETIQEEDALCFSTDKELWNCFKSGNNSAFILIYERFFDSLYSYGMRIHPKPQVVEDAIHDVFVDLKYKSSGLGETDSIKFYLFKCLKRRIYREVRKWTNLKEEFTEMTPFEISFSHEQVLIDKQIDLEKIHQINEAVKKLSPRKREAIYYIYYEGLSYQQVAELMELSDAKSARDLIYKSLKSLRDSLGFLPVFLAALLPQSS